MKVIISHDVDHITIWEHKKDFVIPKFIARSFIELASNHIGASEVWHRFRDIIQNQWHNLDELARFDKDNQIPSTFFIGVSNGKGLNYLLRDADYWIKRMMEQGIDVGVHGIAFDSFQDIRTEYEIFRNITGSSNFGIRMHYLRKNKDTLRLLDESEYAFDTSIYKIENPYKVGKLWEFPLHIMDGCIFLINSRWQNQSLKQAIDSTKRMIDQSFAQGIHYLTINFHDRYFNDSFKAWKEWYIWLVAYLKKNSFDFISYRKAIMELEGVRDPAFN